MLAPQPLKEQNKIKKTSFAGSNERYEIEDADEFRHLVKNQDPSTLSMKGWAFQGVDLSQEDLSPFNINGAYFFGCTFADGINAADIRMRGAHVIENFPEVPFKSFRAFMYTVKELQEVDGAIYQFYLEKADVISMISESTHDYSIKDALYDYLEGKTVVSIMGGHRTLRASPAYREIVLLARSLAREGFLVTTGGGPGAMEAANLGAYLSNRDDAVLEDVLNMLKDGGDIPLEEEYKNTAPADRVIEKYGYPADIPSLGIPTWKYGHEPSNRFACWHAKFFSNAIREDGLISISNCGIIFTQGSAGTRQEIFQDACLNHYASPSECSPMIFLSHSFWHEQGVFPLVANTAAGRPYQDWLLCTDQIGEIVDFVKRFRDERGYSVMTLDDFKGRFWEKEVL